MEEIKFIYTCVRHNGYTFSSSPFTLEDIEDGHAKAWYELNLVTGVVYKRRYTGRKDKNGKEIYEGDIFRIEESGDGVLEDKIFYVVIVWIKEWCMFGSLLVQSEYQDYLAKGIEALDEPLFWTYTLEDTNSIKHFLCGNIYEHKHLLV